MAAEVVKAVVHSQLRDRQNRAVGKKRILNVFHLVTLPPPLTEDQTSLSVSLSFASS